jgi:hypothetical protein
MVHQIQAIRSSSEPHRPGHLIAVEGNKITVDFGEEVKHYRNDDVERLVDIVGIGGEVLVREDFDILRYRTSHFESHCFSIADAEEPWILCDTTPMTSTTPEALAERLTTHGGFLVPGKLLEDGING